MSWSDIPGWFDYSDIYDHYVNTAPADRPSIIVEVGVAFGRSLSYLARRAIDSRKPITVYGVDPWVDDWNPDWSKDETTRPTWGAEHAEWAREQGGPFNAFLTMMQRHAREELEFVRVLRCGSLAAARMLTDIGPGEQPHAVFIDGDHRLGAVERDIQAWKCATHLAGHDYSPDFPGVMQAVQEAFGLTGFEHVGNSWVRKGVG